MSSLPELYGSVASGDAEAPQRIIDGERHASSYYATVSKRIGEINGRDFFELGRRYLALCDVVYKGSDVKLSINGSVPVGDELYAAGFEGYEGVPGTPLDVTQMSEDSFLDVFAKARTVNLRTDPKDKTEDFRHSFAQVEWTAALPKVLSFYAQDGGNYDLPGYERPLQRLLTRKMFFVPGSAPARNLGVNLGIIASLDTRHGKTSKIALPKISSPLRRSLGR